MSVPRAYSRIPGPTPSRKTCTRFQASQIGLKNTLRTSCDPYAGLASRQPVASPRTCLLTAIKSTGLGEISSGMVGVDLGEASDTLLEYTYASQVLFRS